MGMSMLLLPFAHDVLSVGLVSVLMSVGNGIGAGVMLTIGADVAPSERRLRFLGLWRVMSDSGGALGPLVVSTVASTVALAAGIVTVGGIGLISGLMLYRWIPKYLSPVFR
jgi:hypothetical protein